MPLSGVAPGEYVARATVRANNETVTELMRQVQVLAGRASALAAGAVQERVSPAMIAGGDLGQRLIATLQHAPGVPSLSAAAELASAGEWEKVLSVLGPDNDSQRAGVHTLRGLALFALGRTDAAGAAMERAWALDSTSSLTAFFLGWIRSTAGRQADAISAWRAAVSLDRALVPAYLALAQTYVQLSHPELAVQVLEEGLRHVPGSPELGSRLSEIKGR
jgi:tetratricopeptide (TPR) repeat protein